MNSRRKIKLNKVWRRRRCMGCATVFSTEETANLDTCLAVMRDNNPEPFQHNKLFLSLYNSLKHRITALSDASSLTDTIIHNVLNVQTNGSISTYELSSICSTVLRNFDKAAATHYKSFHE